MGDEKRDPKQPTRDSYASWNLPRPAELIPQHGSIVINPDQIDPGEYSLIQNAVEVGQVGVKNSGNTTIEDWYLYTDTGGTANTGTYTWPDPNQSPVTTTFKSIPALTVKANQYPKYKHVQAKCTVQADTVHSHDGGQESRPGR